VAEQFANNVQTTLNGGISSGATSLVVTSATGFPSVGPFRILIDSEIFIVTSRSGTTCTVTPGAEGTTQASHSTGATVTILLTAGALQSVQAAGSQRGYFGDGNDGAATFDGSATPAGSTKNSSTSYTLNRDVYYTSCTVSNGVTVTAAGYRVFVNGTLTLSGTGALDNSGGAGGSGPANATQNGGVQGLAHSIGQNTGSGGSTVSNANGNAGASATTNGFGGAGGAGGNSSGHTGGAGGTVAALSTNRPAQIPEAILAVTSGSGSVATRTYTSLQGGGGGGGGASDGSGATNVGGGGGPGGVVMVAANTITGSGNIQSLGGPGGNATGTNGPGGGGGGGVVILVYGDKSQWTGSCAVTGGAAGTGGNGGAVAGSSGTAIQLAA
jgi:hypothetical protein